MDTILVRLHHVSPPSSFTSHYPQLDNPRSQSLQDQAEHASTKTFITALVFNAIVFGAEVAAFTLFRPYFKAIYEPRTYAPPLS